MPSFFNPVEEGIIPNSLIVLVLFRLEPFGSHSLNKLAERKGFEPPIHFWRIHAFQACSLNHSDTSPFILSAKIRIYFDIKNSKLSIIN